MGHTSSAGVPSLVRKDVCLMQCYPVVGSHFYSGQRDTVKKDLKK